MVIAKTHIKAMNTVKFTMQPPVWGRDRKGINPPKVFPAAWNTIIVSMLLFER